MHLSGLDSAEQLATIFIDWLRSRLEFEEGKEKTVVFKKLYNYITEPYQYVKSDVKATVHDGQLAVNN